MTSQVKSTTLLDLSGHGAFNLLPRKFALRC